MQHEARIEILETKVAHALAAANSDPDAIQAFYAAYTTWYIDGTNGNDAAAGNSPSTPIKTNAELRRRTGNVWYVTHNVDVYYVTTYPTDALSLDVKFMEVAAGAGPVLAFHAPALVSEAREVVPCLSTSAGRPLSIAEAATHEREDATAIFDGHYGVVPQRAEVQPEESQRSVVGVRCRCPSFDYDAIDIKL